uniref:TM2 domain containing 1 n=1 Tax=Latimeria chalumnae TaxID=7897 RepID=H2ZSY1_LATCH|nr:PREDICTED: TM2 domain-containing protein 1 [Latimeria chalumnae]|eukprot:XP_014352297.1 PREDICTED: TM2 domain-containing protein 1 [Latimeria chalumnae]
MAVSRNCRLRLLIIYGFYFCFMYCFTEVSVSATEVDKCSELRLGQYICDNPEINEVTQEPLNCTNSTAYVFCRPAPKIICMDDNGIVVNFTGIQVGFKKSIPCRNVNGYSYKVAVALSLFLGWLGADRFYLGYPALGE